MHDPERESALGQARGKLEAGTGTEEGRQGGQAGGGMTIADEARKQLQDAIDQMKKDVAELESHLPHWVSENTTGTKLYRPIAGQIVTSAARLEHLVKKNTYQP